MKIIERALRGASTLVFLDLEATQISHETIEIGAVMADVDGEGKVRKTYPSFKKYCRAKRPIGRLVSSMTGIDERLLQKEGVTFPEALESLRKYTGYHRENALFLTWGPGDISILECTLKYSPLEDLSFIRFIKRRHLDFQSFLRTYVQDGHGNPLSLHNALAAFRVSPSLHEHDATSDAESLFHLYEAVISSPSILEWEYMKTLSHFGKAPAPLLKVVSDLRDGKTVTPEDYENYVRETFK